MAGPLDRVNKALASVRARAGDCVILLHGLARTEASFLALQTVLEQAGYTVVNQGYASTSAPVEDLAEAALPAALGACPGDGPVHIVTHSMGGILTRVWLSRTRPSRLGRVVMMGPPNRGTELVDALGQIAVFGWLNGPAGQQLGTGEASLPRRLPPADYEVGVIAGTRSVNPVWSAILPGPNDGKVTVEATHVEGEADHVVLPVSHTFMMVNPLAMAQVLLFLRDGAFAPDLTLRDLLSWGGVSGPDRSPG